MLPLTQIPIQTEKMIVDISAEPLVRERLLELGLAPGRWIQVLQQLPLSGPLVVQAGSLMLALRRDEAEQVWVQS
jgi:Fe2+ transport system protein FeoA